MNEYSIALTATEVKAVINETATQTCTHVNSMVNMLHFDKLLFDWPLSSFVKFEDGVAVFNVQCDVDERYTDFVRCPFGNVGDIIHVKEEYMKIDDDAGNVGYIYKADQTGEWLKECKELGFGTWRSRVTMPKVASRIKLQITSIRLLRVQDVTEEDDVAQGVTGSDILGAVRTIEKSEDMPESPSVGGFLYMFDKKYGHGSYKLNPWLWVVDFKLIKETAP